MLLRARANSGGFTLVELIVVMVVLAIAAAMIVPYALDNNDLKATAAARLLSGDLEYAQNQAITYQNPVTVTFDTTNETYTLSNASGTLVEPITKKPYTRNFKTDANLGGVNVYEAKFTGNSPVYSVQFSELGSPNNGGDVKLQAGPNIYEIDVLPATGKITVTQIQS